MKRLCILLSICMISCGIWGCGDSSSGNGAGSFSVDSIDSMVESATEAVDKVTSTVSEQIDMATKKEDPSDTGTSSPGASAPGTSDSSDDSPSPDSSEANAGGGSRDNTPHVLTPTADGIDVKSNDVAAIDCSHADKGYICASYTGSNPKVKLRITKSGGTTYTYDLKGGTEVFPLSAGDGEYSIVIYENISGTDYSTCLSYTVNVAMTDAFGAFLYPNKYVWFTQNSSAVAKGSDLVASADNDLDAVQLIFDYVTKNITYDHDHAANLESGYIPNPDTTLATGIGICLDYASLMACMLRSQQIPCHLEVGYAGTAYHAWISVYITDVGWINGMIQFDGKNWQIMDPTYTANSSEKALREFIGDASNYQVKYIY